MTLLQADRMERPFIISTFPSPRASLHPPRGPLPLPVGTPERILRRQVEGPGGSDPGENCHPWPRLVARRLRVCSSRKGWVDWIPSFESIKGVPQ